MNSIKHLPESVIAHIAAGQVVDRPSSVVKELVENALDAYATDIRILLEDAGKTRILIVDNGEGIPKEDLALSVQRHTTSKIATREDLTALTTFGFRGEALYSIGSVSHMSIKSRRKDEQIGSSLVVHYGTTHDVKPIGMPYGTHIDIAHLFADTPGRKKSLRSNATELSHSLQIIGALSLAHPHVSFSVQHNKRSILSLSPHNDFSDRLPLILGTTIADNLKIPFRKQHSLVNIKGVVGLPDRRSTVSPHQYIFVNNRVITNPTIAAAVRSGCGTLIPSRSQVPFILFIQLNPNRIDANINPQKSDVHFHSTPDIPDLITQTIHEAVKKSGHYYTVQNSNTRMSYETTHALEERESPWDMRKHLSGHEAIGVVDQTYLILPAGNRLYIIDQHAAHERILYEQYVELFSNVSSKSECIALKKPIVFDVPIHEVASLTERLPWFAKRGIYLETLGPQTFIVEKLPPVFLDHDIPALIHELMTNPSGIDSVSHETITYLSCRRAVKKGDPLSPRQRRELIEKLASCKEPDACPHGRPTRIEISSREFERMFGRR